MRKLRARMADMGTACYVYAWPVLKRRVGDMRELQSIGHGLLVTFCSRNRGPNRQGSPDHRNGICIRAEAPLAKSSQVSGSAVQWGRLRGGIALSRPAQGCTSVVWLPAWLPNGRKGAGIRTLSCAPSRTRTYGLLLRRHPRDRAWRGPVWPDVPFGCTDNGWMWPDVALCLRSLAPRLAPRNLVSVANVRMLRPEADP